jgi:type IV secretion system protein TrbF
MALFKRSAKDVALSPAPGMYAEDDPAKIIFDNKTRLQVEKNHWKLFCAALAAIAFVAIATRQPPPSVVRAYGVGADSGGKPVVHELATYRPESQALRYSLRETTERWFTIEPLLDTDIQKSRMAVNIRSVKKQMEGQARSQFDNWFTKDAPYQAVLTNPKMLRQVTVNDVALLEDSTAVITFTTATTQSDSDHPIIQKFALTVRYEIQAPTEDQALKTNPFGIYFPYFTLQQTA